MKNLESSRLSAGVLPTGAGPLRLLALKKTGPVDRKQQVPTSFTRRILQAKHLGRNGPSSFHPALWVFWALESDSTTDLAIQFWERKTQLSMDEQPASPKKHDSNWMQLAGLGWSRLQRRRKSANCGDWTHGSEWRSGVLVIAVAPASMVCWSAESSTLERQDLFQCLGSWNNHERPMNLVQALVWPEKEQWLALIFAVFACWYSKDPFAVRQYPENVLSYWRSTDLASLILFGSQDMKLSFRLSGCSFPAFPASVCFSQADSLVSNSPVLARLQDTMNTAKQSCSTFRISMERFF